MKHGSILNTSTLLSILITIALAYLVSTAHTQQTQTQQTQQNTNDNTERPPQTIGVVQQPQNPDTQNPQAQNVDAVLTPPTANTTQPPQIETAPRWQPTPNLTWQWQISSPYADGEIETALDADVYDIDLFDTPQTQIDALKAQGVKVICYFSAGTWEEWREDIVALERRFQGDEKLDMVKGNRMPWPGEWWLNIRHPITRALMATRLDLAVAKGCDAVEPDNVDAWTYDLTAFPYATEVAHNWQYNQPTWPCEDPPFLDEVEDKGTGFTLTAEDQLDYLRWMATEAHKRGLSIGLKNNGAQARELEPFFDWSLIESCYNYNECHDLDVFVANNKPVFMTQYVPDCILKEGRANSLNGIQSVKPELVQGISQAMSNMCTDAKNNQFSLLVKRYDLQAWNLECSGF